MQKMDKKALVASALRTSFPSFCRRAFVTLHCGHQLSRDLYVEVICASLEKVVSGEVRRLILNLPPRHGKTFLASVCLAAWELAHYPGRAVMIVCYGEELAKDIAYKVREILRSDWFKKTFRCRIAEDRSGVADFRTKDGGGLLATSFGGGTTGRGADLIIVDDPNKIEDASSPELLKRARVLFDTAVASRLNNPKRGRIVVVAHRIHPEDLSGHLLDQGGWEHLKLPLVCEESTAYDYGYGIWKRRKGAFLRADAFSESEVGQCRAQPGFEALYQQNPSGSAWGLEPADFPLLSKAPYSSSGIVLSIDTAQTRGARSSFSVIQVWQPVIDGHFLLDQWRDRATYENLRQALKRLVNRHRPSVILIEQTGVGVALLDEAKQKGPPAGILVQGISPAGKSKVERFAEVVAVLKEKSVRLPESAGWAPLFIDEVTSFPNGDSDDQVDAMTQYLAWVSEKKNKVPAMPPRCVGVAVNRLGLITSGGSPQLPRLPGPPHSRLR